jgi:hypothetical protein
MGYILYIYIYIYIYGGGGGQWNDVMSKSENNEFIGWTTPPPASCNDLLALAHHSLTTE